MPKSDPFTPFVKFGPVVNGRLKLARKVVRDGDVLDIQWPDGSVTTETVHVRDLYEALSIQVSHRGVDATIHLDAKGLLARRHVEALPVPDVRIHVPNGSPVPDPVRVAVVRDRNAYMVSQVTVQPLPAIIRDAARHEATLRQARNAGYHVTYTDTEMSVTYDLSPGPHGEVRDQAVLASFAPHGWRIQRPGTVGCRGQKYTNEGWHEFAQALYRVHNLWVGDALPPLALRRASPGTPLSG